MKTFLFVSAFLLMPLAIPAPAQEPAPVPVTPAAPVENAARQAIEPFFERLSKNDIDGAYDALLKGTKIADSAADVSLLKTKTREAIKTFGPIAGGEFIEAKAVGAHLTRMIYLSLGRDFPMRWRFYFYEAQGRVRLVDIRITDRLAEMFDEPALPAPTP